MSRKMPWFCPRKHVGTVLQTGFGHGVRLGHAATHQARFSLGAGLAHLEDPVQSLGVAQLCPAVFQRLANGSQLRFVQRLKAGEYQHGRKRIQHQMLSNPNSARPAMEDAAGIGGHLKLGNRIEQGLHGSHRKNHKGKSMREAARGGEGGTGKNQSAMKLQWLTAGWQGCWMGAEAGLARVWRSEFPMPGGDTDPLSQAWHQLRSAGFARAQGGGHQTVIVV